MAYLYQAEAPVFFLVTILASFLDHDTTEHAKCRLLTIFTIHTCTCGCGHFCTDILAYLRLKCIVSSLFCDRRMHLKTCVYGMFYSLLCTLHQFGRPTLPPAPHTRARSSSIVWSMAPQVAFTMSWMTLITKWLLTPMLSRDGPRLSELLVRMTYNVSYSEILQWL